MTKFQCQQCNQYFKVNKSSYQHKCRQFLKNYRAYQSLTQHIKNGNVLKNRKVYECLMCHKKEIRFPSKHQCLYRQMVTQTQQNRYENRGKTTQVLPCIDQHKVGHINQSIQNAIQYQILAESSPKRIFRKPVEKRELSQRQDIEPPKPSEDFLERYLDGSRQREIFTGQRFPKRAYSTIGRQNIEKELSVAEIQPLTWPDPTKKQKREKWIADYEKPHQFKSLVDGNTVILQMQAEDEDIPLSLRGQQMQQQKKNPQQALGEQAVLSISRSYKNFVNAFLKRGQAEDAKIRLVIDCFIIKSLTTVSKTDQNLFFTIKPNRRRFNKQVIRERILKNIRKACEKPYLIQQAFASPFIVTQDDDYHAFIPNFLGYLTNFRDRVEAYRCTGSATVIEFFAFSKTKYKVPSRIKRCSRDPATQRQRRRLSQRKYQVKKRKALNTPVQLQSRNKTLEFYEQLQSQVLKKDHDFYKRTILLGKHPKKHQKRYQRKLKTYQHEFIVDRLFDFLSVSEWCLIYRKAQLTSLPCIPEKTNNLSNSLQLSEIIPISFSTLARYQSKCYELYLEKLKESGIECPQNLILKNQSDKKDLMQRFTQFLVRQGQKRNVFAPMEQDIAQFMEKAELIKEFGNIIDIMPSSKDIQDIDLNLLKQHNTLFKIPQGAWQQIKECSACQERITNRDIKVFECMKCQTLYHNQYQCIPSPICMLCERKEISTMQCNPTWPLALYQQDERSSIFKVWHGKEHLAQMTLYRMSIQGFITQGKQFTLRKNRFPIDFNFYPSFNPRFIKLNSNDNSLLRQYQNLEIYPPIFIANAGKLGKGLFAARNIACNQFICWYAGDVLPHWFLKKEEYTSHSIHYTQGPSTLTTYEISPWKLWSFGPMINHASDKKVNVQPCMILSDKGLQIIFKATKKIKESQQLFWDYNIGCKGDYQTGDFE